MANPPNIVNVAQIFGTTETTKLDSTSAIEIMPAVATNYTHKINQIFVANIHGTNASDLDIYIAENTTNTYLVKTITIPADSSMALISSPIYLSYNATGTGNRLMAQAQYADYIDVIVSYEKITDV